MPGTSSNAVNNNRRASALSQGLMYSIIVIAILVLINFFANRYNKSYDSTSNKQFTLSDQTVKIAKNLQQPLTITYWDQPTKFKPAQDLLDRYKNLSTKIDVQYWTPIRSARRPSPPASRRWAPSSSTSAPSIR